MGQRVINWKLLCKAVLQLLLMAAISLNISTANVYVQHPDGSDWNTLLLPDSLLFVPSGIISGTDVLQLQSYHLCKLQSLDEDTRLSIFLHLKCLLEDEGYPWAKHTLFNRGLRDERLNDLCLRAPVCNTSFLL